MINSLEVLDERVVPSGAASSLAAHEAAVVAIDIQFSGVTSKNLTSFEKELSNDRVKLGSISLKTQTAVGTAPKPELASIAKLAHVKKVSMVTTTMTTPSASIVTPTPTPSPTGTKPVVTVPVSTPDPRPVLKAAVISTGSSDTTTPTVTMGATTSHVSTNATVNTTPSGLSAKGTPALATIYQEYQSAGSSFAPTSAESRLYSFSGSSIKLEITTAMGNEGAVLNSLRQLGLQLDTPPTTAGQVAIIEGFIPIAQLPTVAANGEIIGMPPVPTPNLK